MEPCRHIPLTSHNSAGRTSVMPADAIDHPAFHQATIRGAGPLCRWAVGCGLLPSLHWGRASISCRCGSQSQENAFRGVVRGVVDKYAIDQEHGQE